MDVLQWSRHHRLFPGQGDFDLPVFLDHVLAAGYSGPLSLEVFNDSSGSPPRPTAVDALRSLLVLEESLRVRLADGAGDAAGEPGRGSRGWGRARGRGRVEGPGPGRPVWLPLFAPPPAPGPPARAPVLSSWGAACPAPASLAFAEIAAAAADAPALTDALRTLGFTGRRAPDQERGAVAARRGAPRPEHRPGRGRRSW